MRKCLVHKYFLKQRGYNLLKRKRVSRTMQIGLYKHFKGSYYWVQAIARDSDSLEEIVIYVGLYENEFGRNPLWVRKRESFEAPREDGTERYSYIGPYPASAKYITGIILPEED